MISERELKKLEHVRGTLDFSNSLCHTVAFEMIDNLIAEVRELKKMLNDCKHPHCACVCGHQKICPEDGPCATDMTRLEYNQAITDVYRKGIRE